MDPLALTLARIQRHIRHTDLKLLPRWRRAPMRIARFVLAIHRDLTQGYLTLQAMSLVYTTLLSLVPLLAVSFSVLKGFGVHNQVEPNLLNGLAPLGEKGGSARPPCRSAARARGSPARRPSRCRRTQ